MTKGTKIKKEILTDNEFYFIGKILRANSRKFFKQIKTFNQD